MGWFLRGCGSCFFAVAAYAAGIDFTRDIQPLFEKHCYTCHGPQQQLSDLRLDDRESALRGGYSGVAIQPRKSAESKLIRLVEGKEGKAVMPPAGPRLTAAEIQLLRSWIDQGAEWPAVKHATAAPSRKSTHWAFQKPKRTEPPAVRNPAWVHNPIDAFVLARLEAESIQPSSEAGRNTLIRRLSLDLTGLPPTPKEIADFLSDNRPDAYECAVDRLLSSPHYGEKWARYWLDLARYADSDGYEKDLSRPWAWRYRQWVIEVLNRDMPFDQFTMEQMAGDLLPNSTVDQRIATGFHRNTLTNREGGTDPEQFRIEQVIDRTNTLGSVWLGLTVGCAQCHDHKYDPISQREYYQLFAFFNTAEEINIDAPLPGELGPYLHAKPDYDKKRRELLAQYHALELQSEWEKRLIYAGDHRGEQADWDFAYGVLRVVMDQGPKILRMELAKRTDRQRDALTDFFIKRYRDVISKERYEEIKFKELENKLNDLESQLPQFTVAPVIQESAKPSRTYLHVRGDWREKGVEVQPETPAVLHRLLGETRPNRLPLAKWLVSSENPLTARVAVNRFWQELFGRGLVRTSEDFGTQGEKPSHPELLDWLATEFVARGWSMKSMLKLMVTSATYRQSSNVRPELVSRDPDNALLARQSRLRLPAELVRDSALFAGGLLNSQIGGKSVRPPQPPGVAELSYANSVKWPESQGADRYRRGLYIHFQRTTPYPQLMNFDAPNSNVSCTRRQRSNTPLQALNLLNDQVFFEAAQGLAYRVAREAPGGFGNKLDYAYGLALARKPTATETQRMARYFDQEVNALRADLATANALFPARFGGVEPSELAAWVEASRVILNLDEFITRE